MGSQRAKGRKICLALGLPLSLIVRPRGRCWCREQAFRGDKKLPSSRDLGSFFSEFQFQLVGGQPFTKGDNALFSPRGTIGLFP
jgi:hypothetical protein